MDELVRRNLKRHKIRLRNHIVFIRDNLREEFDNFFNNLLLMVRKDWNFFRLQENVIKETKKLSDSIQKGLETIVEEGLGQAIQDPTEGI